MRIRVLPLTIMACLALLGVRVVSAFMPELALVPDIQAESAKPEKKEHKKEPKKEPKKEEKKKEEKKPEGEGGEHGEKKEEKKEPSLCVTKTRPAENLPKYSDAEMDVLQQLAKRREELEKRAQELDLKEAMIAASATQLDTKLADLKKLKGETEAVLAQYDNKEEGNLKSLVKIYETMKPKDAARIFEEVDMPVLLQVVGKMKEQNVSPILAQMTPKRAKEVTQALAERRKMPAGAGR